MHSTRIEDIHGMFYLYGHKKLPNMRLYWMKSEPLFYCQVIAGMFSCNHFMALHRCLHITNASKVCQDKELPEYDKMWQMRWLLTWITNKCEELWNVGQHIMVDEMIVRYKGKYCPARQYMLRKREKWGLKIWCIADSISKFVWRFEVYTSASILYKEEKENEDVNQGQQVVECMVKGLENKGHVVVMDNFFTSMDLFETLLTSGIYATGTMKTNRVGLPNILKVLSSQL